MNPGTSVSFGGNSLQTTSIITNSIGHYDSPVVDAKLIALAHANASTIPYLSYPNKTITIAGKLYVSGNVATMDALIDTFKGYLTGLNKNLDISYNSGTRRYIATMNKTTITRPNDYIGADFSVDFLCTNPFGQDTASTNLFPNILPNGDFETNTTGWSVYHGSTISQSNTQAYIGTYSCKVITTGGGSTNEGLNAAASGLTPNSTYTFSAYVYMPLGVAFTVELDTETTGSTIVQTPTSSWVGTGAWQLVNQTVTLGATETQILPYIYTLTSTTFYIDAAELQSGSTVTPFDQVVGRTLANYTDTCTFLGSAPYQLPVYTVTYTTIGGSPVSGTVSIGNNANGQQVNITRTWTTGDVLVIDTTQRIITVNGLVQNFTGAFPVFAPGASSIGYSDSFASRTFNYSVVYTKLYM